MCLFALLADAYLLSRAVQGAEGALVAGRGASGGGDSEASAGGRGEDQTPGTGHLQVSETTRLTALHRLR